MGSTPKPAHEMTWEMSHSLAVLLPVPTNCTSPWRGATLDRAIPPQLMGQGPPGFLLDQVKGLGLWGRAPKAAARMGGIALRIELAS